MFPLFTGIEYSTVEICSCFSRPSWINFSNVNKKRISPVWHKFLCSDAFPVMTLLSSVKFFSFKVIKLEKSWCLKDYSNQRLNRDVSMQTLDSEITFKVYWFYFQKQQKLSCWDAYTTFKETSRLTMAEIRWKMTNRYHN